MSKSPRRRAKSARRCRPRTILVPPTHRQVKPAANFTLGNVQRIWREIDEESEQYAANLKLPFEAWNNEEGYFKFGYFLDTVDRTLNQDSFSNCNDISSCEGGYDDYWSGRFPFENHPITESTVDVDYTADQRISASYAMLDMPLTSEISVVGGARFALIASFVNSGQATTSAL